MRAHIRLLQFGARTGITTDEAERLYAEGRVLAERLGDPGLRGMIVMASAAARHWRGDTTGAWVQASEAAQLGDVVDDPDVKVALWIGIPIGMSCGWGPLSLGFDRIERLLAVCGRRATRGDHYLRAGADRSPRASKRAVRGTFASCSHGPGSPRGGRPAWRRRVRRRGSRRGPAPRVASRRVPCPTHAGSGAASGRGVQRRSHG